jgi:6-pyruvoyltetrahydropterin/6-carboxytetrahydropterin synthase
MFVSRDFLFDSAHFLTDYYGKCERMHGHTYKLEVTLEGNVQKNGLVIDFVVFKRMVKKQVLDKLDHHVLNDIVKNPSAENVVLWVWDQLQDLQKLLREELDDPNLGEDIKMFFEQHDGKHSLKDHSFDDTLRLHEVKLWETVNTCITYRGE